MNPTPTQPFHRHDLDPDLNRLIDDFLAEVDRLLRKVDRRLPKVQQAKKAGKP